MGEEEDTQKLKREAASSYEYNKDSRWAEYWSNILIPPHMSSRPDVVDHFKQKFYQRYLDPDLRVDPMPTTGSSTRSPPSSRQPTTSSSTPTSSRQPADRSPAPASPVRWDGRTVQFSINAWVFVVAVLAVFPLVPRGLSHRAYRLAFTGTAASSLHSLYSLYGMPRAWNMPALHTWFQPILVTKDFICAVYSLIFITSPLCLQFALIPVLCWSISHVAKFLRTNFARSSIYRKYLEDACVGVDSNATTIGILVSRTQVALGFLLLLSLLFSRQRSIVQTFVYWQLLKLMYHAPVTAGYHRSVWSKVGRTVNPLVQRYVPFLNAPLSFLHKWWLR